MLQGVDRKVSRNERKQNLQDKTSPYFFLVRCICFLVCESVLDTNLASETTYVMSREEIELLVTEVGNRNWWKSSSVKDLPIAKNAVSTLFSHLCRNNFEFSQTYIRELFTQIANGNFMTVKSTERPLLDLVNLQDQYQNDRITRVLNYLHEVLRKNSQYWKMCDSLIELTVKLCLRCASFSTGLK
jgi:hypothetical protein